jgi:hypothetical protein
MPGGWSLVSTKKPRKPKKICESAVQTRTIRELKRADWSHSQKKLKINLQTYCRHSLIESSYIRCHPELIKKNS